MKSHETAKKKNQIFKQQWRSIMQSI